MSENISVREWQEHFKSGYYESKNLITQLDAGWYDWFCPGAALAGRLKKIAKVVMGIKDPFILDNYYVWFKNNCPGSGPLYDDVRFEPLIGERDGKYFVVSLDSPHESAKWTLYTERYGFNAPEFECGNVSEMTKYINSIGPELQQGIVPKFVVEKEAVTAYVLQCGEPKNISVYRESGHCYSYISRRDNRRRTVMAVSSAEDVPAGFDVEQAVLIKGLYIYCPENIGKALPAPKKPADKSQKRKKVPER